MAKTDFKTIDEYIAQYSGQTKDWLELIRATIHQAVPGATERISYQIPLIELNGPILYYSAYKKHVSISCPPPTIAELADELTGYTYSVSTIQFPFDKELPVELIARIAKYRDTYNRQQVKA